MIVSLTPWWEIVKGAPSGSPPHPDDPLTCRKVEKEAWSTGWGGGVGTKSLWGWEMDADSGVEGGGSCKGMGSVTLEFHGGRG